MILNNENMTTVTELFLLGFSRLNEFRIPVFILIFSVYTVTELIDIMVITLTTTTKCLHAPMYFFLKNFLFSQMFAMAMIVPNMLRVIWLHGATISFTFCISQNYLFGAIGGSQCYLLTTMSYDRYLAICRPLHYSTIMGPALQYFLFTFCWMLGFLVTSPVIISLVKLKFCGQNVIVDHFFCDLSPLLSIACSEITTMQIQSLFLASLTLFLPFVLIVVSYIWIFVTILRMSSKLSRKKAFSTCSAHLMVVGILYGTLLVNYLSPVTENTARMLSVVFILGTGLLDPIVYSLRNQEIRGVIYSYICWMK